MKKPDPAAPASLPGTGLRHDAEARLRARQKKPRADAGGTKRKADPQRVFHELQVHQIELEMQNFELQESRNRMEVFVEKYTDLYDFAPVGYFSLDEQGRILEVNLTGATLLGVSRARLIKQRLSPLIAPANRPVFLAFLAQVFASPAKKICEVALMQAGGTSLWARFHGISALGNNGSKKWCRVTVADITAHKLANERVAASEIRYRRLFETAHDGVLLLDPDTRKITEANPFMTRLLGYTRDQLVGKELFEIGLLKDEADSQIMFRKLKRQHEVRYEDLPLESRDGRHQEVEVVANLYQENDRAVIQCNIRDITERKATEAALRASEARYRILFDSGPVAIYSCDGSGVIQNFNRRAAELWGRSPAVGITDERFCGSFKLFRPDGSFMPHKQCPMAMVVSGKMPGVCDGEVLIERTDGSRIIVIVNIRPLKNERGEITGAINCFYDITERKQVEAARHRIEVLAASNQKLEAEIVRRQAVEQSLKKSEQHQRELLSQSRLMQEQMRQLSRQVLQAQEAERKRISRELHDVIAQTLTGITLRLAGLKNEAGLTSKVFGRHLALTQRLVEKSVGIVHRFARELRPAVLDDLGLVPALLSFLKDFTAQTGVRTHLTAFAGVERLDATRRTTLYRVVQEALTNVARHAHASRVEVRIQKLTDGGLCMKIIDDGKSFSVEQTLVVTNGKRLGLLGMRERLEMVGGRFEIESAAGKGTTIIAQLPRGKPGG
ncbi:MAG TPA: PAS domain S-box protein [Verrucomicrobiae bacterium]|nr:PAS domain S-box protein [Verrucomicrobiae bacterium]